MPDDKKALNKKIDLCVLFDYNANPVPTYWNNWDDWLFNYAKILESYWLICKFNIKLL